MYKSLTQNLILANNSAGKRGNIVYGGNLAYGFSGNKNCMDTFKDISNISETSLSLISSDPLRVCLCNESGLPDCMLLVDPTPHSIYPGQTISISVYSSCGPRLGDSCWISVCTILTQVYTQKYYTFQAFTRCSKCWSIFMQFSTLHNILHE